MEKNIRELKVSYLPRPRKGYFPYLRLGGKWLRQAGIEIGQRVTVEVRPGQIIIYTGS